MRQIATAALAVFVTALVSGLAVAGCSSCGCGSVAPRAGGPTPYARCAAADPPAPRQVQAGALTLRLAGRELVLEGAPDPLRIAVFRGAAPHRDPIAPALDAVESAGAHLAIALGGLGDDEASVRASIEALATLGIPVLVLGGGRDDPDLLAAAIAALPDASAQRVIDVSPLRRIRVAGHVLVPVAGAPEGRYASSDRGCGVGDEDLEAIAADLGEATSERRLLLSWAAPEGVAVALGLEGATAGSPAIAALATRIGARGGLHAFPESQAGLLLGGHLVVPPIVGPAPRRADGSAAPTGPLLVSLAADGLRWLGAAPATPLPP